MNPNVLELRNNGGDDHDHDNVRDGSSPTVCVVAPLTTLSGNQATASRIASFFDRAVVISAAPVCETTSSSLLLQVNGTTSCSHVAREPALLWDVCIFVHALRGGAVVFPDLFPQPTATTTTSSSSSYVLQERRLLHAPVAVARKYVLVFGGTDVNEFSMNSHQRDIMEKVIERVDAVVCFSEGFRLTAMERFPNCAAKILQLRQEGGKTWVIPQSVEPTAHDDNNIADKDHLAGEEEENIIARQIIEEAALHSCLPTPAADVRQLHIALLPAGIRHVKDPLFAVDAWKELRHRKTILNNNNDDANISGVILIIAGPSLEAETTQQLQTAMTAYDVRGNKEEGEETTLAHEPLGVYWHPGIEHTLLMRWMRLAGKQLRRDVSRGGSDSIGNMPSLGALTELRTPHLLCVLNTSISEGQSQTLLEAMSAGVPVIGRNNNANSELLRGAPPSLNQHNDQCRGTLVESPHRLADAVQKLSHCRMSPTCAFSQAFVVAAQDYCRQHHSMEDEACRYRHLIAALF
ncbi:glycosyltransferase, putative [Bodo saltans]|uniref:Glycosyltransferase, putative n=1 Tax=Bodo saltans TaxID=75058 RepID=A0A0S4KMJ9_BODSA|nr:glycosyltransferase, putative [Bodo saltans]|eukprot:CUI14730.1 glycosyltransferase, putative [Bodo saltans]